MKVLGSLICIITLAAYCYLHMYPTWDIRTHSQHVFFYDRHGYLLQIKPHTQNNQATQQTSVNHQAPPRRQWVDIDQINPHVIDALLCLEDHQFYQHWGVPWTGILRAVYYNIIARSLRYGGSGLTQQLVKMYRGKSRNLLAKLKEAWFALHLERHWSKSDILEAYINQAYFGNHIQGIALASQKYFSRPQSHLTANQAAYLMALLNAPTLFNPLKNIKKAIPRQQKALRCMTDKGWLTQQEYQWAINTPLHLQIQKIPFEAAHLLSHTHIKYDQHQTTENDPLESRPLSHTGPHIDQHISTSIDLKIQKQAERLTQKHKNKFSHLGVSQVAAVALDNATGHVMFWVGSHDFNDANAGQFDRVMALKQPGSTLKPFLYALALGQEFTATHLLPNHLQYFPTQYGQYHPKNYDQKESMPVPFAFALGNSLNIPSIWLLHQIGTGIWLSQLHQLGLNSLNKSATHYGLGLALGNGEVSLIDLSNAYRVLANEGVYTPWTSQLHLNHSATSLQRVMPRSTAQTITYILSQPRFRSPTFGGVKAFKLPYEIAVKTGTTQGHAVAWTIGYSSQYTVGVWVSAEDQLFMNHITGARGAAPLWASLMSVLHTHQDVKPLAQDLVPSSLISMNRYETNPIPYHQAIKIIYPPHSAKLSFAPSAESYARKIKVKYKVSQLMQSQIKKLPLSRTHSIKLHWYLNQKKIRETELDEQWFYLQSTHKKNQLCARIQFDHLHEMSKVLPQKLIADIQQDKLYHCITFSLSQQYLAPTSVTKEIMHPAQSDDRIHSDIEFR